MAIVISILALLATFSQSYLQWVHNKKSVKPLGQIDLRDRDGQIFVAITNNGVGPLILEEITFARDGKSFHKLSDCLTLDIKNYNYLVIGEGVVKVVPPSTQLQIFDIVFSGTGHDLVIEQIRSELSCLTLHVKGKDIYDKKFKFERNLNWFKRHQKHANSPLVA